MGILPHTPLRKSRECGILESETAYVHARSAPRYYDTVWVAHTIVMTRATPRKWFLCHFCHDSTRRAWATEG